MSIFDTKTRAGATPMRVGEQVASPRPMALSRQSDILDFIVRSGVVKVFAHTRGISIEDGRAYLAKRYPRYDEEATKILCDYQTRGAVAPATTFTPNWAAELVGETQADIIGALMPQSAFAQLAARGLHLPFGRGGRINVPGFNPRVAGVFVREGEPIPVMSGETAGPVLTPKKMAVITTFTWEIDEHSVPAIEALLRARIKESTSIVLDSVLLDDQPGTDWRPAGLMFDGVEMTSSGTVPGDVQSLVDALSDAADYHARDPVLVMSPAQAFAARLHIPKDIPVITSAALPAGAVVAIDAADFVCAGGDAPRFEISDQAAVHMEEVAPRHINDGALASPTRSLWQTATVGLRMVLKVDWALRRPGAAAFIKRGKVILTAPFSAPQADASADAQVESRGSLKVGDHVWVEPIGYYQVENIQDDT